MPLAGLRIPTHEGNVRLIVHGVLSDVEHPERSRITGINSMFRLHAAWASHGFYGMSGAERLREICAAAFDPIPSAEDRDAFERGARRIAGIVLEGRVPGSEEDERVFWSALIRLGDALGIEVPPLESVRPAGAFPRPEEVDAHVSA